MNPPPKINLTVWNIPIEITVICTVADITHGTFTNEGEEYFVTLVGPSYKIYSIIRTRDSVQFYPPT